MDIQDLRRNQPYRFVPVHTGALRVHDANFHDGSASQVYSGEIRCCMITKTPTFVGHYQYKFEHAIDELKQRHLTAPADKSVVEPMFAWWGSDATPGPVVIPGTSIKGMLRHAIGAMTNAPMEHVANNEKDNEGNSHIFSIRPQLGVPEADKRGQTGELHYYSADALQEPEKGKALKIEWGDAAKKQFEDSLPECIPVDIVNNYIRTNKSAYQEQDSKRTVKKDDNIIVEYNVRQNSIVSFGKISLYRWGSRESTQRTALDVAGTTRDSQGRSPRPETHPPSDEKVTDESAKLTGVRLIMGYVDGGAVCVEDNANQLGIGERDYARLAGRISVNYAVEALSGNNASGTRFVKHWRNGQFSDHHDLQLKILSSPKPSAFWCYIQPGTDPDISSIGDWGDTPSRLEQGSPLAGRKFYSRFPITDKAIQTINEGEITGNQNSIVRYVSAADRKFQFTVRFKELAASELGLLLLALQPELSQDVNATNRGTQQAPALWHAIGRGRPLGMGSVQLMASEVRCFNTKALEWQAMSNKVKQVAIEKAMDTLVNHEGLGALVQVMTPLREAPDLSRYYGSPDQHNAVKTQFLDKRRADNA